MANTAEELIAMFGQLPVEEKRKVVVGISQLVKRQEQIPSLDDADLVEAADWLFQMYDTEEEAHGESPAPSW